jgi:hypothetical protein
MYYRPKEGPRFEYQQQEIQRVNAAPRLIDKFPKLKSLVLELGHFGPGGKNRNSQVKFTPNLDTAKAVFRINCPNQGCIGGDFDLTKPVAKAVTEHRATLTDEMCCQGWLNKTTIDTVHCNNILRYKISLTY